jgi:hypothetical protein
MEDQSKEIISKKKEMEQGEPKVIKDPPKEKITGSLQEKEMMEREEPKKEILVNQPKEILIKARE